MTRPLPDEAGLLELLQQQVLAALPDGHPHPDLQRYYQLMRDYPQRGGKRLRGLFVLASTAAHGGDWQAALPAAAALELFQNWVLVHDDIEDDSLERRGAPTLHRQVGLPIALNVGDAMHVYMWQLLLGMTDGQPASSPAADGRAPTGDVDAIRQEFLRIIHRTAEGQHLDLCWVAEERFRIQEADYLRMVRLKTSWYTVIGPLRIGAFASGRLPHPDYEELGGRLGAAFQIRDDVLNLQPQAATGKEFAGDLFEGKRTLILAHLFAHAGRDQAAEAEDRLRRPRAERSEEDVRRLLQLIEAHGSLAYAQTIAEREASAALAGLRQAFADLPEQETARMLLRRFADLAHRAS